MKEVEILTLAKLLVLARLLALAKILALPSGTYRVFWKSGGSNVYKLDLSLERPKIRSIEGGYILSYNWWLDVKSTELISLDNPN